MAGDRTRFPAGGKSRQLLFLREYTLISGYFVVAEGWRAQPFSHHHSPVEVEREVEAVAGFKVPAAPELDRKGDLAFAGQCRLGFQAHVRNPSPLIPYCRENSLL